MQGGSNINNFAANNHNLAHAGWINNFAVNKHNLARAGWRKNPEDFWKYDLENNPIQLRTEYEVGSGEVLEIFLDDDEEDDAGDIYIYFDNPLKYELYGCTNDKTDFHTELPAEVVKVWTFTLSRDDGERRVVIHCNDEEVLNLVLSGETCDDSDWRDYWDLDVASLHIEGGDGFYRPGWWPKSNVSKV